MGHLELLAPELIIDILASASSIHDLASLTKASRACRQVLEVYPIATLLPVLQNELDPSILRDLLAVFHVPSIFAAASSSREVRAAAGDVPVDTQPNQEKATAILQDFINYYLSDQPFGLPTNIPAGEMVSLMSRLLTRVARLTDKYFSFTCARLASYVEVMEGHVPYQPDLAPVTAPLTMTERCRIQGGFLRYELYYRLFPFDLKCPAADIATGLPVTPADQFKFFMKPSPLKLREGFDAILHFLADVATSYVMDMEDQFIDACINGLGAQVDPSPAASPPATGSEWSDEESESNDEGVEKSEEDPEWNDKGVERSDEGTEYSNEWGDVPPRYTYEPYFWAKDSFVSFCGAAGKLLPREEQPNTPCDPDLSKRDPWAM